MVISLSHSGYATNSREGSHKRVILPPSGPNEATLSLPQEAALAELAEKMEGIPGAHALDSTFLLKVGWRRDD